ncbi:UDP-glucose--hexose-1-phosphate uridylyltransferase [Halanaerobium hydrogeniformans]|uniref:Galactose-1-phosphate uridylyltransferase n=1 Tax=Halanaerobium hydrogeniformans TaxID=656519 RepID=E4RNE1_HALHG|nr:UDP-glucose--hexose-1-phosphate uridylyltransferase [Halanaerobium hydrogeniformans]ADQ13609.1 UDP-glucose--hexose-1-phosphate uridylyltransferase [Halanaerobium hydrogeniformans]
MRELKANQLIEKLLAYGEKNNLLVEWDKIAARNEIRDILEIKEAPAEALDSESELELADNPQPILDGLLDFAVAKSLINDNLTERDLLDTRIMGALTPRQSEIAKRFYETAEEIDVKAAAEQYYNFAQKSNYIRLKRTSKNLNWKADSDYGQIEITINLSKPEKDPAEIAKAKAEPQSNYPKCYLCLENVGYAGSLNHPARQNHRVIPLKLQNEDWFLQYSPYVYYNEHCIVFHREHKPMNINKNTFAVLMDFLDQIPHYFIGSNADLPLVGGSILNHDHFQGGRHIFPMEEAESVAYYEHPTFMDVEISRLKWPLSVIRLRSAERGELINLADKILQNWREYTDHGLKIKAYSKEDGKKIAHNTVTPIARKRKYGGEEQAEQYELDLVLRNNRCSEEYPYGIFHPHQKLHHIKKENIGLIEVMGRAILPGRLKKELNLIAEYLSAKLSLEELKAAEGMAKHLEWVEELESTYGNELQFEQAEKILEKETAKKFSQVLERAGVFKNDQKGNDGFNKFLQTIGIKRV